MTKRQNIIHSLNNQLNEQNEYVKELEAKIELLLTERDQSKFLTPEGKEQKDDEIEIVIKSPDSEPHGEIIATTKATSNKKKIEPIEEADFSGDHFADIMNSPEIKRKEIAKINSLYSSLKPPKTNSLHSSLPASLRDTSYFDGKDQIRTLLGQNKGRTDEKYKENREKQEAEISYNDGDVNIETDFEFE